MVNFKLDTENTNLYRALNVIIGIIIAFVFIFTLAMLIKYHLFFTIKIN